MMLYNLLGNLASIHVLRHRRHTLDLNSNFVLLLICLVREGFIFHTRKRWRGDSKDTHIYTDIRLISYVCLQAVFDSLFLIFANLVYSVTAILNPHQVNKIFQNIPPNFTPALQKLNYPINFTF